ncbi:38K protein [Crangon crangon nudivirus]|uniref:38K protein n=1 Tax=Crangon crangon nudivirus TaxID=2880838 RepID=A0AAE8Y0M6_9VIRU|nr:38K protein [Crangon crangon nudivirus]UBZ25546.1 38K protein [Crangon crangon nudivirus]
MKTLAFVTTGSHVDFTQHKYLTMLHDIYTHYSIVYLVNCRSRRKVSAALLEQYKIMTQRQPANTTHDMIDFKIVFISAINPLLKNYSVSIAIECPVDTSTPSQIHVDYGQVSVITDLQGIYTKRDIFIRNSRHSPEPVSVIVYDLDDTIINRDGDYITSNIKELINHSRRYFDYIFLWSHGCSRHVENAKQTCINGIGFDFDYIISKRTMDTISNKGFGKVFRILNEQYGVATIAYSALVDDLASNYVGDYDCFLHISDSETKNRDRELAVNFNLMEKYVTKLRNESKKHMLSFDLTRLALPDKY